jgi:hypothetical protein
MVGVPPAILANGPDSTPPSPGEPVPELSFSSPATNLLNLFQTESDIVPVLGIQEFDSSFGDCFSLLMKSSTAASRSE